jgi:hypothetical protein
MPIIKAFWNKNRALDLHVIKGESSPDLRRKHVAVTKPDGSSETAGDYLDDPINPKDIKVEFKPLFKGVSDPAKPHIFVGGGVEVDTTTGVVKVKDPLPNPHLRNFIMVVEVTNNEDGKVYTLSVRIHIHGSVTDFWLTPPTLTIRPNGPGRPDLTKYMFTARARFDDGTLGDVTEDHDITWFPLDRFHPDLDEIILRPGDDPDDTITVTALLPVRLGGASATGTLKIAKPWGDPTTASIVAGGGWPGQINPAVVPNILFLCDGFTNAPVDKDRFEQLTNSIVKRLKTSGLTTPFDKLATSINFWRAFISSDVRGISVLCEVYTKVEEGETRAYMVNNPFKPPATGDWTLGNVVYAVGLPVRADHTSNAARTNAQIRSDWRTLYSPDPNPKITDDLLKQWRLLGNRTFIGEKDTPLCMAYGRTPQVDQLSDHLVVSFHPRRLKRARREDEDQSRFDLLLESMRTPRGIALNQIWAEKSKVRPSNYGYLFILTSSKSGRPAHITQRGTAGFITMSVEERPFLKGITVAANNELVWNPPDPPAVASASSARSAAHELGHSFGLGDEYALGIEKFTGTADSLNRYGNLQAQADAKFNGNIHGDEIKWNWLRAHKGALVRSVSLIPPIGEDRWEVKVRSGQGLQFAKGNTVILRKRDYPRPLRKDPKESSQLTVDEKPTSDRVIVKGALPIGLDFVEGDVLYMPRVAPASVKSPIYPFAELVAFNIKKLITDRKRSLSGEPCSLEQSSASYQLPDLDVDSLGLDIRILPTIVGLYDGGDEAACGIFHPAGRCMMNNSDSAESFCAVCRYILVETIDPYKHFEIDLLYEKFYPQR